MQSIEHSSPLVEVRIATRSRAAEIGESYRTLGRRGRSALVSALSAVVAGGLVLLMPRGPITAGQALTALLAGLALGAAAGCIMRSRWAMLTASGGSGLGLAFLALAIYVYWPLVRGHKRVVEPSGTLVGDREGTQ